MTTLNARVTTTKYFFLVMLLQILVGCQVLNGEERPGQYIDDSHITARVKNALVKNDRYYFRVHVETKQGNVLLSGFVHHIQNKNKATRIAKSVPGVVSVRNAIAVK